MSLEARMRQLLAEMSVISEKQATSLEAKTKGGEPDRAPHGDNHTIGEEWWERFSQAPGPRSQFFVWWEGRRALNGVKYGPKELPAEQLVPGSFRWKCAVADDKREADEVGRVYGVHRSTVYRYRLTYRGLDKCR